MSAREIVATQMPAPPAPPARPREIEEDEVEDFVAANRFAVIEVATQWCSFCRAFEPHLREAARERAGTSAFARLDGDFSEGFVAKHHVMSYPTTFFYRDGRLVEVLVGYLPPSTLAEHLDDLVEGA